MAQQDKQLSVFPAFFKVENAVVAVFGEGDEAYAKARLLKNTAAHIIAYAVDPEPDYAAFLVAQGIERIAEPFDPLQVQGARLVFAATGNGALDREIVTAAREARIPANAVDQPDWCDFYTPALVNRAPIAVAIGTEGVGPVLAQMIRADIDRLLPRSLGRLGRLANS
ncbi:MAG: bifunctional precorrin-2 dehydrogenase/sirohydrochlorin ferrochelatase, partial [Rhizobium sp.]|nr:bifunctional precorrin-2 dehydrogenase/sirohydrochlorin ferrochelatase [Rhizobium sp.]